MKYLALIPVLLHVYIFWMESLAWGRLPSRRAFGVRPEQVETLRPWAFNQGWYNLFLAAAAAAGLFVPGDVGAALASYGLGSMAAAALVLLVSNPAKARAAAIQGLPAVLGLACFWLWR